MAETLLICVSVTLPADKRRGGAATPLPLWHLFSRCAGGARGGAAHARHLRLAYLATSRPSSRRCLLMPLRLTGTKLSRPTWRFAYVGGALKPSGGGAAHFAGGRGL